jgi:hypothetical protein
MDWSSGTTRLRESLELRDWQAVQRRVRDMEADEIDSYQTGDKGALIVQKATDDFEADAKNNLEPSAQRQYKILLALEVALKEPRAQRE